MRVSEGVPQGRFVNLYHPELLEEHEEVIIFTRKDFNNFHRSIEEQIDVITRYNMLATDDREHSLWGHWHQIYDRIRLIDLNLDLVFADESLQSSLDAYLYDMIDYFENEVDTKSKIKSSAQIQLPI